ncbi:MAG: DUF1318 domain-containing protein [Zetaproteobacteria bacterium]|nr:MAG: DUF1318 domain-containing protein [Zetaproteobacteria bacterium]
MLVQSQAICRLIIAFGLFLSVATPSIEAQAVTLHEAKLQGLVGEQSNGYLGIVHPPASPEIRRLVNEINRKRKTRYRSIASRTGTTLDQVEALAGKKAIEKTAPGLFVRLPSGRWIRKR